MSYAVVRDLASAQIKINTILSGSFLQCKTEFKKVATVTLVFTGPGKQPGDVGHVKFY